jgi:hypothetical protein
VIDPSRFFITKDRGGYVVGDKATGKPVPGQMPYPTPQGAEMALRKGTGRSLGRFSAGGTPDLRIKTQALRVADVAFIGPVMIAAGVMESGLPKELRAALMWSGIGTIVFNGMNFLMLASEPR